MRLKGAKVARIAGVDLPKEKRIEAALPYLFGIGPTLARKIIATCDIDANIRTKDLTEDQINKLQREIEKYKVEGDLRREIQSNIKRLQEIGSYRGIRHSKNLPVRGQRTRVNARTKRGKRVTIGTVRKDIVSKTVAVESQTKKPEAST
jgi:small subunit ribosomal protein S13